MVFVFDGEDTATSRLKLTTSIDRDASILRLDGKKDSLAAVTDALVHGSLFSSKKTIVIEYFSKIKPQSKLFEALDGYIKDKETNILLWDSVAVKSKETTKSGIVHYTFDFPKVFYTFLDGLVPKSSKRNVALLHEIMKNMAAEQLFFSLSKRVRHLLYMKTGEFQEFSEIKKMAPWQLSKLSKQAAFWSESELKRFLVRLAETDEAIKTSALPMPLSRHLDILLTTTLN